MPNQEIDKGRRNFLKTAVQVAAGGALSSLGAGCGSTPTEVKPAELTPVPEATKEPTLTPPRLSEILSTPTSAPIVTPDVRPTVSPEAIVFPQTEITAELFKQGFANIGEPEETIDLSKMATPTPGEAETVTWKIIEGYTSLAWDEQIALADLAQDELKAAQVVIALGARAGVEGFYRPAGVLPQFGDLTLLRLTLNQLPNNQDFLEAELNASPNNLIIRKGTHMTVLGLWADESGRWATVAIDEGFNREEQGIAPRDVPRHFLAVIPQNLPPEAEGLSLERLINAVPGRTYQNGVVEYVEQDKVYHQELNVVEPTLAKKLERKAGALFMDRKEDGFWYENPIVPYPPAETQSIHTVKSGETLSKIAQEYGLTQEEILKANPEITDPSKINVGQELTILIPGFTNYWGPTETEDGRIVILSADQTKELAEAVYDEANKEWKWQTTAVAEPTVVPTVAPTAEPQPTTEAQPTRGPGALYEKDFPHLRKEGGEWRFGEIARIEETEDQRLFSLAGVILSEPEKRQVNALDSNGNIIYKYENWFVKIGYPDPQEEGGKLVTGEMEVWFEGVTQAAPVVFAKDGFIESRLPGGTGYDVIVRDRDEFLANFKYGEPVIVAILFDSPNGTMKRLLSKYAPGESFPGVTSIGKNIYFLSLLFDDENGIGKLDLPPLPTSEELKAWQEGRQLPRTNFLGCLNRVIVSGK